MLNALDVHAVLFSQRTIFQNADNQNFLSGLSFVVKDEENVRIHDASKLVR